MGTMLATSTITQMKQDYVYYRAMPDSFCVMPTSSLAVLRK